MSDKKDGPFNLPSPSSDGAAAEPLALASAKAMPASPAPPAAIEQILQAGAAQTPDHGKLFPWRFIVFEGKGRDALRRHLWLRVLEADGERPKQIAEERDALLRAPVVIGVESPLSAEMHKIPVWEQELSAGAVCQTILIAAHALGFVGNWLTEWYAYHPAVKEKLGLKAGERVARLHFATSAPRLRRAGRHGLRPELEKIVQLLFRPRLIQKL